MSRILKSTLFSLILALSLVSFAHAQGIPGVGSPLTLTLNPENPRPGENVTMTLSSFNIDLNEADITWTVGGKVIASGRGIKTANVIAGSLGSEKTVDVDVNSSQSGDFTESATIRPSDLSILWQAATYVPPFYKGKALETFGGSYKVVAIPDIIDGSGRRIDPKKLVYTWKKNDAIDSDQSGYGRNYFISDQTGFTRAGDDISVDVMSPSDGYTISGNITITPTRPEIHLYENNPLYGTIYANELPNQINLANEEISIAAEPYFFSVKDAGSSIMTYSWTLNDTPVSDFQNKNVITLRKTGGAGVAQLDLSAANTVKLLQSSNQSLVIRYE